MGHYIQAVSIRWYNACAYYNVSLGMGLARLGHRVTVAGSAGSPALDRARNAGLNIFPLPDAGSGNPLALIGAVNRCRRYIRENNVTSVAVVAGSDHMLWALALRGTRIPLVRMFCNRIVSRPNPGIRLLMSATDSFVASCLPLQQQYISLYGMEQARIPVLNGGVDTARFQPDYPRDRLRSKLGIPESAFVVGVIGRFSPVKGHRYIIDAVSEASQACPNLHLVISGSDAQLSRDDIAAMVRNAGIANRTTDIGRTKDVREVIAALDVGIVASTGSEVICRIAMEYLAMGRPVIATDTNVLPEIITDGETGRIVPAGNSTAITGAIVDLATPGDHLHRMSLAARRRAESHFSLEAFARDYLKLCSKESESE